MDVLLTVFVLVALWPSGQGQSSSPVVVTMPAVPVEDLTAFVGQAHTAMHQRFHSLEPAIYRKGVRQTPGSPEWFMSVSHTPREATRNMTHAALLAEEATKYIAQALGLTADQVHFGLPEMDVSATSLTDSCPATTELPCEPHKYRALSGHCNNVQNPHWGTAGSRYVRFLPPDYTDGISLPRGVATKGVRAMPSAREVSLAVHSSVDIPHSHLVSLFPVWAQFVAHDISLTPQMTGFNGERLKCCGIDFSDFHPECFPIRLPDTDPVFGPSRQRCQEYPRSASAPRTGCTLGPREQMNDATSFLDGSVIYGNTQEEADALRSFTGGELKVQTSTKFGPLMPPGDNTAFCRYSISHKCFKSGDVRANEYIGLTALHTLWVREHNRVARGLREINPHWLDELLFQETRRIIIAELQHITYAEFLPLVLGKNTVKDFGMELEKEEYFTGYNMNVNPGIANAVGAAALYFFISLVPKSLTIFDKNGRRITEESIAKTFYAPFDLYKTGGFDSTLRSLLQSSAQSHDQHINSVFTSHMFQVSTTGNGLDLAAQVIQQGRDHGLPTYTLWREFCGFGPIKAFRDLTVHMEADAVIALQSIYENISDVDLLPGALSERPLNGSTVGPTLHCLLARQFSLLRRGDRHWYESDVPPSSFSREQLKAIRGGASLARIICDNGDDMVAVQPNAFVTSDPYLNNQMKCNSGAIRPLDLKPWREIQPLIHISPKLLTEVVSRSKRQLEQEWQLYRASQNADPQSPIGTAFGFNRPKRQSAVIANTSFILEMASANMIRSFLQGKLQDVETGNVRDLVTMLPSIDISTIGLSPELECDEVALPCDHTRKYRTITGWCNNLHNPSFGKSFQPFIRLLPAVYEDGLGTPRSLSVTGSTLPSPRLVSRSVHTDTSNLHSRYTLLVMQMAQITDHDLTFTPVNKGFINEGILNCLSCDSGTTVHPQCFPIPVPEGDPFFPSTNDTNGEPFCIPATRSMPGQRTLGPREQINQLTAYLDMSFVYGSDACEARMLRSFSGGRLNFTKNPNRGGRALLPEIINHIECRQPNKVCFIAGDARASEQPGLGSLHTIFMREHNRIVFELSVHNPHWGDEVLYQETRRIMGAMYQHMIFNEWLPTIFGWEGVRKHGLTLQHEGYYKGYDPNCDGTVVNEFSAAAFRFGHSLLRPVFRRVDPTYKEKQPPVRLRDHFFKPAVLYQPNMIEEIILGLVDTPMETLDNFITDEVTNHLFEIKNVLYSGMDLISLNMQRARDHGIRGYNHYREFCNLTRARDFDELRGEISPELIKILRKVYAHVDDIDLFPGGMSERPLPGGVLGPTFACIDGHQFRRIRSCDRFWYENDDPLIRFTPAQLTEIRKMTIARLICNTVDTLSIQRHALELPDPFMNPRVSCTSIPKVDLSAWRDRAACAVGKIAIDIGATQYLSPCTSCTCTKEGPICQSVKVSNCFQLARQFTSQAVLADTVCKVQCAFVFRALQEFSEPLTDNQLGFS